MQLNSDNGDRLAALWVASQNRREQWALACAQQLVDLGGCAFKARSGAMLYFVHRSTKGYSYQCSVFIKGLGAVSDTQHASADGVFAGDARGAGLSPDLEPVPLADLDSVIQSFMPA